MRFTIHLLQCALFAATAWATPTPLLSSDRAVKQYAPTEGQPIRNDLVRRSDDENTVNLCHSPTSKFYIHLQDPTNANITLYVNFLWYIHYPKQLTPKLIAAGFSLTTPRGKAQCGWMLVDKVSALAVERGDIGYRQAAGWDANTTHAPSEESLAKIRDVLLDTYPGVEIAVILLFTVVFPVLMCLYFWHFGCCCKCCAKRETSKAKPAAEIRTEGSQVSGNNLEFELAEIDPQTIHEPPPYTSKGHAEDTKEMR